MKIAISATGKTLDADGYAKITAPYGYEGNAFASSSDAVEDLFSITAVHPMREDAVAEFLENARTDWGMV